MNSHAHGSLGAGALVRMVPGWVNPAQVALGTSGPYFAPVLPDPFRRQWPGPGLTQPSHLHIGQCHLKADVGSLSPSLATW